MNDDLDRPRLNGWIGNSKHWHELLQNRIQIQVDWHMLIEASVKQLIIRLVFFEFLHEAGEIAKVFRAAVAQHILAFAVLAVFTDQLEEQIWRQEDAFTAAGVDDLVRRVIFYFEYKIFLGVIIVLEDG